MNQLIKRIFSKNYLFLLSGFVFILLLEGTMYFITNNEFFLRFNAESEHYTPSLKGVSHDLNLYPEILLNIREPEFAFFGYFFYFMIISSVYIIIKGERKSLIFLIWWLALLFYLQYGSMRLDSYVLMQRIWRFLNIITIPSVLSVSFLLVKNNPRYRKYILPICVTFLFITSLYYVNSIYVRMTDAMIDIRLVTDYIENYPPKFIYADPTSMDRITFLFGYEKSHLLRDLTTVKNPDEIKDAFVIVDSDRGFVEVPSLKAQLPKFLWDPPKSWEKVKVIDDSVYGFYGTYNTTIYYVL